jgi:hypothetical protein
VLHEAGGAELFTGVWHAWWSAENRPQVVLLPLMHARRISWLGCKLAAWLCFTPAAPEYMHEATVLSCALQTSAVHMPDEHVLMRFAAAAAGLPVPTASTVLSSSSLT